MKKLFILIYSCLVLLMAWTAFGYPPVPIVHWGSLSETQIPDTDNTYDLGSSTYEWKDLYIDGVAYIDTLVYGTKRYYPATLSDTATPHVLTAAECSGGLITTQGWNGTDNIVFTLPDISGYGGTEPVLKVKFLDIKGMQDADADLDINPDDATQIVLDGVITGTDGDSVYFDDVVIYSSIVCHSAYDATLKGFWVCDTINGVSADKGS